MRYRNQATQRVLSVLLSSGRQARASRRDAKLRALLGMNKNMVHRALTTLVAAGYVDARCLAASCISSARMFCRCREGRAAEIDIVALARPVLEGFIG